MQRLLACKVAAKPQLLRYDCVSCHHPKLGMGMPKQSLHLIVNCAEASLRFELPWELQLRAQREFPIVL